MSVCWRGTVHRLPPEPFIGAGIYAIYYVGDFEAYRPNAAANRDGNYQWPIYVGKDLALHHNKCAEQRFFRESSVPGCRAWQCEVHAAKDSAVEYGGTLGCE